MFSFKSQHSYSELLEGIVIGGSLAAAATFLFGTKKGKELQKDLVRKYKKIGHVTHEMKQKFDKRIQAELAKNKRKVKKAKRVAKRIKTKANAVKEKIERKAA